MRWLFKPRLHCRDGVYLIIIVLIATVFWMAQPARIQTVNLRQLTRDFAAEINTLHVSASVAQQLARQFADSLPATLTHYAKHHGVVLISSTGVLAGARDATRAIERTVKVSLHTTRQIKKPGGIKKITALQEAV